MRRRPRFALIRRPTTDREPPGWREDCKRRSWRVFEKRDEIRYPLALPGGPHNGKAGRAQVPIPDARTEGGFFSASGGADRALPIRPSPHPTALSPGFQHRSQP